MTGKTPLVLGSLLILLLGLATLLGKLYPTQKEYETVRRRVFPELRNVDVDDVVKIELVKGGEEAVFEYDRANDRWLMVKPHKLLADRTSVRNIAFDLKNLSFRTISGEEEEGAGVIKKVDKTRLIEYGLDDPEVKVTLVYRPDGSEQSITLLVGKETADEESRYVQVEGRDEVYIVSKYSISTLVDKDLVDFRQKKLITVGRWDAVQLTLERAGAERIHAEKQDGEWRLLEPISDKADETRIGSLIAAVYDTQIDAEEGYVDLDLTDEELAKYGLDKPAVTVAVGREITEEDEADEEEDEKKRIVIERVVFGKTFEKEEDGKKTRYVYARLGELDYVVAVSAGVLKELEVSPSDLRSRDVVDVAANEVDYIEILQGDSRIILAKPELSWRIYEPKNVLAHSESVEKLVQTIDDLNVKEFLDDAKPEEYGLDKPTAIVKLYKDALRGDEEDSEEKDEHDKKVPEPKGEPIVVAFGKHDPDKEVIYVRRDDEKTILAVAADSVWQQVTASYLAYRDRQVLSFSRPDVVQLTIDRDGVTYRVEKRKVKEGGIETDKWFLTSPVEAPADRTAVDDILWDLSNLDATKFYADKIDDAKKYGFDQPTVRCTVTLKPESKGEEESSEEKDEDDKKKSQYVLVVGKKVADEDEYYARLGDEELVFGLAERIVDLLTAELRDRTLLDFAVDDVETLRLSYADGKRLELAYREGDDDLKKWTVVGRDDFELDTEKVREFVRYLSKLKADRFAQYTGPFKKEYGLDKPQLVVEVRLDDESSYRLSVGAQGEGESWYAIVGDRKEGAVAIVSGSELADALKGPDAFAKQPEEKEQEEKEQAEEKPDKEQQEPKQQQGEQTETTSDKPTAKKDGSAKKQSGSSKSDGKADKSTGTGQRAKEKQPEQADKPSERPKQEQQGRQPKQKEGEAESTKSQPRADGKQSGGETKNDQQSGGDQDKRSSESKKKTDDQNDGQ